MNLFVWVTDHYQFYTCVSLRLWLHLRRTDFWMHTKEGSCINLLPLGYWEPVSVQLCVGRDSKFDNFCEILYCEWCYWDATSSTITLERQVFVKRKDPRGRDWWRVTSGLSVCCADISFVNYRLACWECSPALQRRWWWERENEHAWLQLDQLTHPVFPLL